jgi:hypothetical protein
MIISIEMTFENIIVEITLYFKPWLQCVPRVKLSKLKGLNCLSIGIRVKLKFTEF